MALPQPIDQLLKGYPVQPGDKKMLRDLVRAARFSRTKHTVQDWLANDVSVNRARVIGTHYPWNPQPGVTQVTLTANMELQSDEWHVVKHRAQGHLAPTTTLADYYDDMRHALSEPLQSLIIAVGFDGNGPRVCVLLRLGNNGAPCRFVRWAPGVHLFIAYDPDKNRIVTAFPLDAGAVAGGYPFWGNKVGVP